ncbi:hypothetical protein F751_0098 [Auxenochlorella protothecoides]|uniref:Uncharacterized protein n=1 Tax=Auxenochlorella protothecoides TaxID=3075 RepID=A0A087S9P7_AUXPR|nr:hypothetical protein F751_0098 [Auxenochlorella protothecoides]KFM22451.1 hypothetical protein F751_0098 [Auxenochlorella protothecoides]
MEGPWACAAGQTRDSLTPWRRGRSRCNTRRSAPSHHANEVDAAALEETGDLSAKILPGKWLGEGGSWGVCVHGRFPKKCNNQVTTNNFKKSGSH